MTLNPHRLTVARKRRGWSKRRLAETVGVSRRSLERYERGLQSPTFPVLTRLADELAFRVDFLTADDPSEPAVESFSFRSLSRMPASIRDQAVGAATIAIDITRWLEQLFDLPEPNIPDWELVEPELVAEGLRAEWGLGVQPLPNLTHLLESQGVWVFSLVEECGHLDAVSFWHDFKPYVLVNTRRSPSRIRMSLAHELGHLVLHRHGANRPAHRIAEHEAQRFAGAFLMPTSSVLAAVPRGALITDLLPYKQTWGVSLQALIYRMHQVGLLTDWQYRMAFIEINQRGWRQEEPNEFAGESSQILYKALQALRSEGISRSDIAEQLGLYQDDLDTLIFGLAPTALPDLIDDTHGSEPPITQSDPVDDSPKSFAAPMFTG